MPDRVVVATHEVTRTGAPMSLLHLLRWLTANTDLEIELIVAGLGKDGGQLLGDFEAVVPTRVAPHLFAPSWRPGRVPDCDVLYLNSVFAAGCLAHLPRRRPRIISRVPELSMALRQLEEEDGRTALFAETDRFIAVSEAVRRMLVDEHGVDADRIAVVHGSVDLAGVEPLTPAAAAALRDRIGIPAGALVVGAAGTTDWRKGPDLFVRVAMAVRERLVGHEVHFVWLGGEPGGPEFWRAENRVRPSQIPAGVHFLGSQPNPLDYLGLMDVFALTSREDPFPRVCMEAAAVGTPIVTFDNGGAPELVRKGCGFVVPYLDVEQMADRVVELLTDEPLRGRLGATGAEVVRAEHTVETGGPATLQEIERELSRVGAP